MTENADTNSPSPETFGQNNSSPENGNRKPKRARLMATWGLTGFLVVIIVLVMALSGFRKDETPALTEKN